jgi:hypothetical protein
MPAPHPAEDTLWSEEQEVREILLAFHAYLMAAGIALASGLFGYFMGVRTNVHAAVDEVFRRDCSGRAERKIRPLE